MTVRELTEKLMEFALDSEVVIWEEADCASVNTVRYRFERRIEDIEGSRRQVVIECA